MQCIILSHTLTHEGEYMNFLTNLKQCAAIFALIGFASLSSYASHEKEPVETLCGVEMKSEPIYNTLTPHFRSETYNYVIAAIKVDTYNIRTCSTKDGNFAIVGLYSDGQVRAYVFESSDRAFIYSYSF